MTAIALRPPSPIVRPALILGGLTAGVALRWLATIQGAASPVAIGLFFGLGLLGVGLVGGWRLKPELRSSIALGAAGGAVLVALAVATQSTQLPALAPATAFGPWAAVTILVASAEEIVLRGALFETVEKDLGTVAAVLVTSIVFALMHVPLYGWQVVPLDFGVGLWLAGLRLATGGIVAPAMAHAIADLATWWL